MKVTTNSKEKLLIYAIVLEAVQDSASNQSQDVRTLDKNRKLVIEKLDANCQFQLSHFLLAPIRHMTHELHDNYDFTTYITEIVDKKMEQFIHPKMVIHTLSKLHKNGLNIAEVKASKLYLLDNLYDLTDI
ncbi:hypothetical protein FITA111629_14480 [Filibacter tadaridae]|uniref:Uncharacterized protein n=1 Tax=Filibacter tadaridae TaxID=2483811 RepID=A0A3P5WYB9_9BACL|nr:hypothetical protein [Filibacter tadaridae]VDC24030.1 hypothetical protein FILTAD_00995 [Filibacter tadaridae]